jgi:hypothetical protein
MTTTTTEEDRDLLSDEEARRIVLEVVEFLSTPEGGGATDEQLLAAGEEVRQWIIAGALLSTWRARKIALTVSDDGTVGVRLMPPMLRERIARLNEDPGAGAAPTS